MPGGLDRHGAQVKIVGPKELRNRFMKERLQVEKLYA